MQNTHSAVMLPNQVMALFADRALSFGLSKDATLADLADRLGHLSAWQPGAPQAIYMKFPPISHPIHIRQSGA